MNTGETVAYGMAGVVLLVVLLTYVPKIGGWLLLLTVIALTMSPRARAIITSKG